MKRLLFTLLFFTQLSLANDEKLPKEIHEVCKTEPVSCLETAEELYSQLSEHSPAWYKLKSYEITAEYYLAQYEKILSLTSPLVDSPDLPKEFQFMVNVFHSKSQVAAGNDDAWLEYLYKAKAIYAELDARVSDPKRLMLYGNLLLTEAHFVRTTSEPKVYRRKYRETVKELLAMLQGVAHLNDPYLMEQLHTDIGHIYSALGNNTKAIYYRAKAVFWGKQIHNEQQIATIINNLARSYQKSNQPRRALKEFNLALPLYEKAQDTNSIINCKLRLAELHLQLGDRELSQKFLSSIESISKKLELNQRQKKFYRQLVQTSG